MLNYSLHGAFHVTFFNNHIVPVTLGDARLVGSRHKGSTELLSDQVRRRRPSHPALLTANVICKTRLGSAASVGLSFELIRYRTQLLFHKALRN